MTSPDRSGLCIVCNKSNAYLCTRCENACYCSRACQRADWPLHKLLCRTFSNFEALSRPTDQHFRAILFSVDEVKPKFIWLHCTWNDDEDFRFQEPDFKLLLGPHPLPVDMPIQQNPVLKRNLSDTIFVSYSDTARLNGLKSNRSIAAITATKQGQYHDWRGPIIAYGKKGAGNDQADCRDIDMNDFRHLTDFFLSYDYRPAIAIGEPFGEKVKGVKINCIGDQKMFNKPLFEAVEIPSTDPIFSMHDTSDIAKRIELPIFTRRCPSNPKWMNDPHNKIFESESPFTNMDSTFLHLCCDPNAEFDLGTGTLGWGLAPKLWQRDVGTVIVVRQDKKPLSPLHVEALCKYCRYEISPLLSHCAGEYAPEEPMEKNAVLPMICRPTFIIYWCKFSDEKVKEGDFTYAPSPYDV